LKSGKDIPRILKPSTSGKAGELISRDVDLMARSYKRLFPMVVKRVDGSIVEDVNGNLYIDFTAGFGLLPIGGSHPEVVKAVREQLDKASSYSLVAAYSEEAVELAEELSRIVPIRGDVRLIFCNSVDEAVDAGIRSAKWHSGKSMVACFFGEYHGVVGYSLMASTDVRERRISTRILDMVYFMDHGCEDCFLELTPDKCNVKCLEIFRSFIDSIAPGDLAAIIFNPVRMSRFLSFPSESYVNRLLSLSKDLGSLLLVNESITAPARTGRWFILDHWNAKADIVCLGAQLSAGIPLGVLIAREDLMDLEPGMHESLTGGCQLSIASALATLRVIREEGLVERSERLGRRILGRLKDLIADMDVSWRVGGLGMLVGIGIVGEAEARSKLIAQKIVDELFRVGVLVRRIGSVLLLTPPLNIKEEILERGLSILEEKLREFIRLSQAS